MFRWIWIRETGEVRLARNDREFYTWHAATNRSLALTHVCMTEVSTVFVSYDMRFGREGPPILWETMVFGGPPDVDGRRRRYASQEEALAGHREMVAEVFAALRAAARAR